MKHLIFILCSIVLANTGSAQTSVPQSEEYVPVPDVLFEGQLADAFRQGELLQSPYLEFSHQYQVYEDITGTKTLAEIQANSAAFKPYQPDAQILHPKSVYWFRLLLHNTANQRRELMVQCNSRLDYLDVYMLREDKAQIQAKSGQMRSPSSKSLLYPMGKNAFYIPLNPHETLELFIRADQRKHIGSGWKDVQVFTTRMYNKAFIEKDLNEIYRIDLLYLSIFLSFSLYHLLLFTGSREKEYLYYALSILCISLWNAADRLVLYEYFSGFFGFSIIKPLAIFGSAYFLMLFTKTFLNLKNHQPGMHKFFSWGQSLLLVIPFYVFIKEIWRPTFLLHHAETIQQLYQSYEVLMGIFFISLVIIVSFRLSRQGYPPAQFYFYSFTIYFMLILGLYLVIYLSREEWIALDILKVNAYLSYFNISTNSLILFVFSLAIGRKMNQLQKDKFEAVEKNLLLQRDINQTLEKKVTERTLALNEANLSLKEQNLQLGELNEELNTLNDEKDNLIKIVAHNLGTPLAANNMYLGLLSRHGSNLSEDQQDYVNTIKLANQNLITMINRILDISHLETTSVHLEPEVIRVHQLLKEVIRNFTAIARQKNIDIQQHFGDQQAEIWADRSYLIQIIENLLGNAIKFSPYDKKITVETSSTGNTVAISIKDEGPGICDEDRAKMFKIYQMLSAKPTAGENSTGLGLYIVKKYTEAMEGSIREIGQEGKGANFVLEFKQHHN